MTDKEKIVKIIDINGVYNGKSLSFDYYVVQPDDLADALIKAGYGDVKEWKRRAEKAERDVKEWKDRAGKHRVFTLPDGTIKQTYSNEEVEEIVRQRDEYKHRAEVAEKERDEYRKSTRIAVRALEIIKRNIIRYCAADFPNILQQAEREIAEEERK